MTTATLADTFTDEVLDELRTTRHAYHPPSQQQCVALGDELLVDVGDYYEGGGLQWCSFLFSSPGGAAVYPYKVQIPERGVGQYRASEVLGWRRPVALHQELRAAWAVLVAEATLIEARRASDAVPSV